MKTVLVIGGGFAGSLVAQKLEKKFDVTLIDSKDYFEFTPGIIRTLVDPKRIKKVQILHTHYLKKAKFIRGIVSEVGKNYVTLDKREKDKINFDYLCICSGSEYDVPIKAKNLVSASRSVQLRNYHHRLDLAKKVLIIGGGLVGVELAAEIVTHYTGKKSKEITIVHALGKLMERNNSKAIIYAENWLKNKGARIIYNEFVLGVKNGYYFTNKGSKFKVDLAFLCTGIKPSFEFMKNNFKRSLNKKNYILVNRYLQLEGYKNIFSAGDVSGINMEKTAQNAKHQAIIISKNIINLERRQDLEEYSTKITPLVISLGKWNGLFVWKSFVFPGIISAFLKTVIEKREMWKLKLRVLNFPL